MTKYTLLLNKMNIIHYFVKAIEKLDCDVDVTRGRYVIDAKSIMGLMTLNLSEPVEIILYSDDTNVNNNMKEIIANIEEMIKND